MDVNEKFGYVTSEEMCIDWEESGIGKREFCRQLCDTPDACEDIFDEDECEDMVRDCIEDCEIRLELC